MSRARERPSPEVVFAYPAAPHVRRHGPRGYVDDEHYKPWLRDEFTFRCVYCRCREVWFPDGDRNFSVEHVRPTSLAPEGLTAYETLVYACCQCNSARPVGAELPEMALFLRPDRYVNVPLAATYQAAYRGMPAFWRDVLEGREPQVS